MSATALLANPRLFASCQESRSERSRDDGGCLMRDGKPTALGRLQIADEYLGCVERFPDGTLDRMISDHLLTLLRPDLDSKV